MACYKYENVKGMIRYFTDAQGRRRSGHLTRLEVRRYGRGQTVPYYLYPVHYHRHVSRAVVRAAHHGVVAARPLASASAYALPFVNIL